MTLLGRKIPYVFEGKETHDGRARARARLTLPPVSSTDLGAPDRPSVRPRPGWQRKRSQDDESFVAHIPQSATAIFWKRTC